MCGIAGIMAAAEAPLISFRELRGMLAMLSHRGPDGYGLYRDQGSASRILGSALSISQAEPSH
jgi:asparagine synthetase B (glutamine-hydrolysing)